MDNDYLRTFRDATRKFDREISEFLDQAKPEIDRAEKIQRFIKMMVAPNVIHNGGNGHLNIGGDGGAPKGADPLTTAMSRAGAEEEEVVAAPAKPSIAKTGAAAKAQA